MSVIKFPCPHCGQQMNADADAQNTVITCPHCSADCQVPIYSPSPVRPCRPYRHYPARPFVAFLTAAVMVGVVYTAYIMCRPMSQEQSGYIHTTSPIIGFAKWQLGSRLNEQEMTKDEVGGWFFSDDDTNNAPFRSIWITADTNQIIYSITCLVDKENKHETMREVRKALVQKYGKQDVFRTQYLTIENKTHRISFHGDSGWVIYEDSELKGKMDLLQSSLKNQATQQLKKKL